MLQTLKNAWRTKEIRGKIIFTLIILLIYRIGTVIPVPFVNASRFEMQFSGTILGYLNTLSGNSLASATLFALGVSPYINASIIIQLLSVVFPKLAEIAKEDKKKMSFITRIVTIILAIVTAIGYYFLLKQNGFLTAAAEGSLGWFYAIVIIACFCAGASIIMWLADRINEHGIGNGISMILFANILSGAPSMVIDMFNLIRYSFALGSSAIYGIISVIFVVVMLLVILAMTIFVIFITGSERRIPVQYAKRVVGRKMYGGQSSNIPIKLNMTGVMPVIFASSIVTLVPTILNFCRITENTEGGWGTFAWIMGQNGPLYPILLFVLIIAFAYFYTQITFNPMDVANNLKKQGGAIPGIRQGKPTSDFIKKILNKITLAGALFLSVIAVLPAIVGPHLIDPLIDWIVSGWTGSYITSEMAVLGPNNHPLMQGFSFGGTSLIIVVGVALETFRDLEAQLTMRNYKGFLN